MKVSKNIWGILAALALILLLGIFNQASADEVYINGGLGRTFGSDWLSASGDMTCTKYHKYQMCQEGADTPIGRNIGQLEAGYRQDAWNNGSVIYMVQHTSNLQKGDKGFNAVFIKLEHRWKIK